MVVFSEMLMFMALLFAIKEGRIINYEANV
jgi:hypothetical protein